MNFDSDKKEDMDGEMGNTFKNYINQPKPVVMDKSGNVIVSSSEQKLQKDQVEVRQPPKLK